MSDKSFTQGGTVQKTRVIGLAAALAAALAAPASAQTIKIGIINSFSGFLAQPGDQMEKGIELYAKEHEKDLPPGVKVELVKRDDTSEAEVGKRVAQELITREHVQLLLGVIGSPQATAIAPLTMEAKDSVHHHQCWRRGYYAAFALCRA